MTAERIERDDWLQHAAALRRFAASFLGDEHEADDLHGGRREAWALALAPLVERNSGTVMSAPLAALGWLMGTKLALTGVAALVVVVGFVLFQRRTHPGEPQASEASAAAPRALEPEGELRTRLGRALAVRRESVPVAPAGSVPTSADGAVVQGRVVLEDAQGRELEHESGTLTIATFHDEPSVVVNECPFAEAPGASRFPRASSSPWRSSSSVGARRSCPRRARSRPDPNRSSCAASCSRMAGCA